MTRLIPYLRFAPYAAIAFLALLVAIQTMNARHWQKRYIGAEKAHTATVDRYKGAQRVAAELNAAKVARIKREYDTIAQRTESEYEIHLADNRRSLRSWMQANAANQRSASSAATGQAPAMSGQAMPGPAQTEFLVAGSDLEIAADNYSQLLSLIEWAKSIGGVK